MGSPLTKLIPGDQPPSYCNRWGETGDPPTADQSGRTIGDVAVGPSENEAKATGPPHTNELEDPEEEVRHAFWELLKTVGYEVWET